MSNQIENKQMALAQLLANNRLTKIAGDQTITHKTPEDQKSLGKEQTEEIKNLEGINAATPPAADAVTPEKVDTPPNCQDLNKKPEAAMAGTGSTVSVMDQAGNPANLKKSAADYRHELAVILHKMNDSAMQKKAAEEQLNENFRTGTEVMQKLAALTPQSTEEDIKAAQDELVKLASTNPVFQEIRNQLLMQKLAADVEELAAAEGISPEEAAAALDEAAAADPSIMADAEDEATGEAVAGLADAEAQTDELMQGVQQLADGASAYTGQEVTADDILNAIDEVEAKAEKLNVPPEALIQAAMEEMQGGAGGGEAEVTPEDEANAQAIMDEAAANGISPDEVLQMAAEELGGGEGAAPAAAPAEAAPAEPAPAEAAPTEPAPAEGEKKEATGEGKPSEDKKEDGEKKEAGFQFKSERAAKASKLLHDKKAAAAKKAN